MLEQKEKQSKIQRSSLNYLYLAILNNDNDNDNDNKNDTDVDVDASLANNASSSGNCIQLKINLLKNKWMIPTTIATAMRVVS